VSRKCPRLDEKLVAGAGFEPPPLGAPPVTYCKIKPLNPLNAPKTPESHTYYTRGPLAFDTIPRCSPSIVAT
jgi:hypothetical protein